MSDWIVKHISNSRSLVYEKANVFVNGSTTEVIDLRGTPSGIYMVTFTSATSNITKKVIINKN
ncbi:MAG: T9SS type A sorting domain-containing protein [Bacteroidia bacterium]